jgi:hypothetical protein
MNYDIIQPPQKLAGYIRFFWFCEVHATIHKPFVHHAFAYACPELIFCHKGQFKYNAALEAERTLASGIYGQTQTFSRVASKEDFGIFGLYLYPHTLPQLFGIPATELTNQNVDIKTIFGKEGEILEERIMLAVNNHQRMKLICDFLEARLKNAKTAFENIISSIEYGYYDESHFIHDFQKFSGCNPKGYFKEETLAASDRGTVEFKF